MKTSNVKNRGTDQSARAAQADQSLYGILLTCFRQTFQESILSKKSSASMDFQVNPVLARKSFI